MDTAEDNPWLSAFYKIASVITLLKITALIGQQNWPELLLYVTAFFVLVLILKLSTGSEKARQAAHDMENLEETVKAGKAIPAGVSVFRIGRRKK